MKKIVQISEIEYLGNNKLRVVFNDKIEKIIDFALLFPSSPMTDLLRDPEVFQQVKLYEHGRGLYWPNGYDACPDYLRYYT